MYDFDPTDPLLLGGADLLTEDERTVGLAYLRLAPLLETLQSHPFHRWACAELRAYLDGPAFEAVEAFQRLCDEGTAHLVERLEELDPTQEQGWE
ncbi:hypothetical protein ABZ249_12265 [Nocardiopsis sp. NPDC006139]|uniref:hypothetical protein n=1 Tax=Nocardiopsis sp. NPDC006139 TaxID=3154578 RepID=UPI0033BA3950